MTLKDLEHPEQTSEGLRERKKRETKKRIMEAGIGLFIKNGIDQTTLEEIAVASGISRRTFFHYFDSKDDILLSMLSGLGQALTDAVRSSKRLTPMLVVKDAVFNVCGTIPLDEMIELDQLMRTSQSVMASKQAFYVQQEDAVYAALKERWPEPHRSIGLRTTAMFAVGAIRIAGNIFHEERSGQTMVEILETIFKVEDKVSSGD